MDDNLNNDIILDVINDILDSLYMADETPDKITYHTVRDYIANHYMD